ncbi:MAG: phosphonomutase [Frankiales bacterium]|nr:phosphonomutase [Frankiales bacterium]
MSEQTASVFRNLHSAPELLVLVNVWDVISARVVADLPGCQALATASHSIAASLGYADGENIPVAEMLAAVGRIAAATSLPVTADLEAGYGDPAETVRRAISLGVVGANIEDRNRPEAEAVAAVAAVVKAAVAEGVPSFVLNARTDALLIGADRPREQVMADAIARGRAFVDAGAPVVFVPGKVSADEVAALVEGIGPLSLICSPASIPLAQMQELGVQRASLGPWSQRIALTGLAEAGSALLAGGAFPSGVQALN